MVRHALQACMIEKVLEGFGQDKMIELQRPGTCGKALVPAMM